MNDLEAAKSALKSLLAMHTVNSQAKYYAKLALSHIEGATNDSGQRAIAVDLDTGTGGPESPRVFG
jgi:hypothetical protein